ncbi:hypothetical protein [Streptomyces sp. NPDC052107]|uniref:hypothetical protein n=1 Tax=Streptomyces sp. NPDC052107 TaxID=3155632 RepID=UPI00341F9C36
MNYLDEAPFVAQGIAVTPFQPPTANTWSSGRRDSAVTGLMTLGPAALADELMAVAARAAFQTAA